MLAKALADEVSDIRRLAVDQAVEVGDEELIAMLPALAEREQDVSLQMHIEWVLRNVHNG